MYNTLYEAADSTSFPWLICIAFGVAVAAIFVLALRKWKEKSKGDKLIIVIPIVLLMIYASWLYSSINLPDLYDMYIDGDYSICEGIIEDYKTKESINTDFDEFTVDGIAFKISSHPSIDFGYLCRSDGGVLEDGMQVRICYIEYNGINIIMKIEATTEIE
ncbi:MAG: hypothetical protein IKJ04_04520 [Clostridia bacterium]|nr:hypothetical protein [Clostridia bacterium]